MPIEIVNENNTMIEEMKKQFKKVSVFVISSFAQTIIQSLTSIKVAQTELNWNNLKTSCKYSAGILMLETLLEPKKFQWISNIKSWIYSKINPQHQTEATNLQFAKSLFGLTTISIFQSYCTVLLDKLSNNKLETFFDLDILKDTGTDFLLTTTFAIIEEKIIEIWIENFNKFKDNKKKISDLNDSQSQDIESGSIEQEEIEHIPTPRDSRDETTLLNEKNSYKSLLLTPLLSLFLTTFTWLNESLINRTDINFKKFLTDLPILWMCNVGSSFFSFVNCIVNGDEFPLYSSFNKCTKNKTITPSNTINDSEKEETVSVSGNTNLITVSVEDTPNIEQISENSNTLASTISGSNSSLKDIQDDSEDSKIDVGWKEKVNLKKSDEYNTPSYTIESKNNVAIL